MAHPLLRPMAVILGLMNAASMIHGATFVLFAQEVMGIGPFLFAVIGFGGAAGALVGGEPRAEDLGQARQRIGAGAGRRRDDRRRRC